ncbi:hypothetical protein [Flectobacillus roseus]|uniref:DUF560 domain-containing protein n=1 Tax=Flectobacillus roseus TaxID=502259 RepID=A0ABT6YDF4_9BACT|nr:hypothetical protein [Flectobacillus roseus]MDI9861236.1 hypothetical protein [Flectobacillus roseus]
MITTHVTHAIREVVVRKVFKLLCYLFIVILSFFESKAQTTYNEGVVTYFNSENIYVRFDHAQSLRVNDTLEIFTQNQWVKGLLVKAISSKSCVTQSILGNTIALNTPVRYALKVSPKPAELKTEKSQTSVQVDSSTSKPVPAVAVRKQTFDGRFYVSSYGNIGSGESNFNQVRTTLSFDINNIEGGKFSFQNYITYRPRFGPSASSGTFADDFKVYALALNYELNAKTNLTLGRKISNYISNMGAVDGLQIEHKYKKMVFGGFAGFAPDFFDYSFNPSLLQYGAFVAHDYQGDNGQVQTSFAIAEQRNASKVDRRFLYLQHNNTIVKNMSLFYSLELDLYQNINNVQTNDVQLTSTYVSLRYRPFKRFNITASYDNRRNVIYYETYRTFIDQLINQETRQGYRLQFNHNMSNYLSWNFSGFYRFESSRPEPTKNYVIGLNMAQLLGNRSNLNFNYNMMNTYYFDGNILTARLNQDILKSKISLEFEYRKVDYTFFSDFQPSLQQNIFGFSTSYYTQKRTSIMLSYEGTFEPDKKYHRYFVTFSQRFRNKK